LFISLVEAKATKSQFTGNTTWAGAGAPDDRVAGKTTHRKNRDTYLDISSDNNVLDGATLLRIVNFNRNDLKNNVQRWGKFEITYDQVVLWRGSWSGHRKAGEATVEEFVGHGVRQDLIGLKIKFTMTDLDPDTPGSNIFGEILNPNK
jgi:hypothetical protein